MAKNSLSEAERGEIRKKMLLLVAEKDTLSPQELKDFIYLVCDLIVGGKEREDDYDFYLPNKKNREIHIEIDESIDYVGVFILDGLGKESGETVTSTESDGKLSWCIGLSDSFYSRLLDRSIFLGDNADYIMSEESLTPAECQKLAKLIYSYLPQ